MSEILCEEMIPGINIIEEIVFSLKQSTSPVGITNTPEIIPA